MARQADTRCFAKELAICLVTLWTLENIDEEELGRETWSEE